MAGMSANGKKPSSRTTHEMHAAGNKGEKAASQKQTAKRGEATTGRKSGKTASKGRGEK